VFRLDESAFGQEIIRLFPVSWCSMHFSIDREDCRDSSYRAAITVVVDENDVRFSCSAAASWGEQSQRLFDDSSRIGQIVGEMWPTSEK
jgi:hypothetical protein